jgi:uncharacterized protein (DUF58 family)
MFLTRRAPAAAVTAAIVGTLVAALTGWSAALLAGIADAAIVIVVALDVVVAPKPSSLRPVRELPDAASTGDENAIRVTLHNPARRALAVSLRDASPPSLQRSPLKHHAVVPSGARVEFTGTIRPARRGRIPVGPITLRVAGPAGLAGRQSRIDDRAAIKVFPALPGRAEVELRLTRARLLQSGERSSAVRGGGTEFESLREYHPDDEFRRINWRATARTSKTISNVFREERNQQVLLVLDAGRMMAANLEGVSRFEHAIDAAMAVAELAARIGDHVGMAAFSRDLIAAVPLRGGRSQPGRILNALYAVEPTLDAPNYPQVFSALLSRYRKRSLIMLVTELTDVTAMEPLLRAVPALVRRHLVVVGALTDPGVEQLALAQPASSEDAYFKAAASGSLVARADTASRLRSMGAVVVDRPPGRLAGALADHYLRVKAFGRL